MSLAGPLWLTVAVLMSRVQHAAGWSASPIRDEPAAPLIHPFEGMLVRCVVVDDQLTRSPLGLELHDVDVLMGHFRDAVSGGTGRARHDHVAQGPCLAVRVRDLPP